MGFWRSLLHNIARNPISFFAVVCVASTAAFLGWLTYRVLKVLESPAWCGKAIQAERITDSGSFKGLESCLALLTVQLEAIATGFHISTGGFVFVLIVLIVVVVAGAKANFKLGATGLEGSVGKEEAPAIAAQTVADSAQETADVIKEETKP